MKFTGITFFASFTLLFLRNFQLHVHYATWNCPEFNMALSSGFILDNYSWPIFRFVDFFSTSFQSVVKSTLWFPKNQAIFSFRICICFTSYIVLFWWDYPFFHSFKQVFLCKPCPYLQWICFSLCWCKCWWSQVVPVIPADCAHSFYFFACLVVLCVH